MSGIARLVRLGCLGFVLAALAGCALAGPMYDDIKDLQETMRSKDDPQPTRQFRMHDYLPAERTPAPGKDILPGQFLDTNGTVMDAEAAGVLAAGADYVLIGEGHTVPCDHLVQASLLRAMAKAGHKPVVGLEMVATDHRDGLHGFNIGRYGPDVLDRALDWENTWGHPYSLYRPVFDAAHELGLKLEALNVPRSVIRAVSEGGIESLTPEQSGQLPVAVVEASAPQRTYLEEEFQRHQNMRAHGAENATSDDGEALERFLLVQALWDTKMAEEAVHARRRHGGPVAVLAGAGHVEYGWGIGLRLARLDPTAKVMTVMPWRGDPVDRSRATVFFYCPMSHTSRLGFTLEMSPDAGALVTAVDPGSKAEAAGLAAGDVIAGAQGEPVKEMLDLHMAAIKARKAGEDLVFTVMRDGAEIEVRIPLAATGADGSGADDAGTP